VDEIVYKPITDETTRLTALRAGDTDLVNEVLIQMVAKKPSESPITRKELYATMLEIVQREVPAIFWGSSLMSSRPEATSGALNRIFPAASVM
jgi:ABC-type transport system substrate-binding protein